MFIVESLISIVACIKRKLNKQRKGFDAPKCLDGSFIVCSTILSIPEICFFKVNKKVQNNFYSLIVFFLKTVFSNMSSSR